MCSDFIVIETFVDTILGSIISILRRNSGSVFLQIFFW